MSIAVCSEKGLFRAQLQVSIYIHALYQAILLFRDQSGADMENAVSSGIVPCLLYIIYCILSTKQARNRS